MAKWLARNLGNLIIVGLIVVGLYYFFKDIPAEQIFTSARNLVLVVVGLGLVIFIHELGHFLAAKACGVKVETFSIGFGRAIPGCSWRRGETEYKLAVFPLGGYVKMLGENPGEKAEDDKGEEVEIADDPRAFPNKPVGQRMIIISAGVIMNVILGLLCFIYVYKMGKTEVAARFGTIEPGSPADRKGLRPGSTLLQVNDNERPIFEDLFFASAFSTPYESTLHLRWLPPGPGGEARQADLFTVKKEGDLKPTIGVGIPQGLVISKMMRHAHKPEYAGVPAAQAAFKVRDRLLAVAPAGRTDWRPLKTGWDLVQAEYDFRGRPVQFKVLRSKETPEEAIVTVEPQFIHTFGFRMAMGTVRCIGDDAPQELKDKARELDVIVALDGNADFDPLRLPDLVMDQARKSADGMVELAFRRDAVADLIKVRVKPDLSRGTWNEEHPISPSAPVSIPALGLAYTVKTTVAQAPGDSRIQRGDVIREIIFPEVGDSPRSPHKLAVDHWPWIFWMLQLQPVKTFQVKVTRGDQELPDPIEVTLTPDASWPMPSRGMENIVDRDLETFYADGVGHAIQLGFKDTYRTIGRIYLNLKGLVTGTVSYKLLHGPIAIPEMAYGMADRSFTDLVLFLGMISINLAVVNFLPIPVLDGGHMMFLIVEKIRGKPASERVLIAANIVGIVLLGCLMLFVIWLDISRLGWARRLFS